ncbi:MAG: hypothetical protein XD52_1487 [bacterium 42_11]|nr:MAG: hypothetical protein XD52_1487 [bacterium 42_11]
MNFKNPPETWKVVRSALSLKTFYEIETKLQGSF